MWTPQVFFFLNCLPTCSLKQEELPGLLVRKELKQVQLPKVKQDDCGFSQYFTPDKTNPSFKNPVLQILRCAFHGGGPPASSSFDLYEWSNSRGWLKPCSRALVAQAKYKGAFFILSLPLYKSPCRNQNQVAKASTWGLWEVLGIMYLSGRRNAWHQWQTSSERGEKKRRSLAKGDAETQSQWSCTSYTEYSDHHKMHLWRHQKVTRFACVLIAPWKMLVRSHNSTKQPKWQQWAQPVPALPFAAPPWRCGSNVLPRGMLTGNGTWPAPESSSVTGIFLNSPASFLKPLAIVARNDCTNCSISALLRHTKRISISFFGVVQRGHGPNEMVTAMGGCCRECNKRAGAIESQPCSSVPLKNQTCSVYCIARAIKRLRGPRPLPRRRAKDLNWTLPSKCPVMWFHLFPLSFRHKKACQW